MQQEAARVAAEAAQQALRETEAMEAARREAELAKLRNSATPSIRSLSLVAAAQVPAALGYCQAGPQGLRRADRSWWKCLHFLEAEGLTPPSTGMLHAGHSAPAVLTLCLHPGPNP